MGTHAEDGKAHDLEKAGSNQIPRLERMLNVVQELRLSGHDREIREEIDKIQSQQLYLAVVGQFKRGKTSLINALLGEALLPTGVIPVTSVIVLLRYNPSLHVEVIGIDQQRLAIDREQLPQYATEEGNPGNEKQVRYISIGYPSALLSQGVVLIDTPGIGSLALQNTETTRSFVPHIDAALFVLSPDPPITEAESHFLDEVLEHSPAVFVVMNKADLLSSAELEKAVAYLRSSLGDERRNRIEAILPVSSRLALDTKPDSGTDGTVDHGKIRDLRTLLKVFFAGKRTEILGQRTEERSDALAESLRFALDLEIRTLNTPLALFEERNRLFQSSLASLGADRRRAFHQLTGMLKDIETLIDEELQEFKSRETAELERALGAWWKEVVHTSPRKAKKEIEERLSRSLITDFEKWRPGFEKKVTGQYAEIAGSYVEGANVFIDRVARLSSELFELPMHRFPPIEGIAWRERMRYVTTDDPVFFDVDPIGIGSFVLPKSITRKMMMRRFTLSISDKVERNCGRLRWTVVYSMQETTRDLVSDLTQKLDQFVDNVMQILRDVAMRKSSEQSTVEARVSHLRALLRSIHED